MRICHSVLALLAVVSAVHAQQRGVSSSPTTLVPAGSQVFFLAETTKLGRELWRTDGTADGTRLVRDFAPGPASSDLRNFVAGEGVLYFTRYNPPNSEIWKSDGTSEGTSVVWSGLSGPFLLAPTRNGLVFMLAFGAYWAVDGPDRQARTIAPASFAYWAPDSIMPFAAVPVLDGVAFFLPQKASPRGVWRTDGTAAGTVLHFPYTDADGLVFVGHDTLYFIATKSGEVWRIPPDGPAAQMTTRGQLLLSYLATARSAERTCIGLVSSQLQQTIATTDGTPAGTSAISGLVWHEPLNLAAVGRTCFFDKDTLHGYGDLWSTDGTVAGTRRVAPSIEAGKSRAPLGPLLLFDAFETKESFLRDPPWELWRSDGTSAGTQLVRDIAPGIDVATGEPAGSNPSDFVRWRDSILFTADDHVHGRELWITDGTAAGTRLVANIAAESSIEGRITAAGSGAPLPGVTVEVYANSFARPVLLTTAASDPTGHYRIEGLRDGKYYLQTRNSGGYVDEVYRHIRCAPCEPLQGTAVIVALDEALTGYDFELSPRAAPKRRAAGR